MKSFKSFKPFKSLNGFNGLNLLNVLNFLCFSQLEADLLRYLMSHPPDFTCVYSVEPVEKLRKARQTDPAEKDFLDRGRPRAALGSLPTITGIFGLTIANTAIKMLIAKPGAKA